MRELVRAHVDRGQCSAVDREALRCKQVEDRHRNASSVRPPRSPQEQTRREKHERVASNCRFTTFPRTDPPTRRGSERLLTEHKKCLHAVDAECMRSVFLRAIQFKHIVFAIQPLLSERRPCGALVHFPGLNSRAIAGSLGNIVMLTVSGERDTLMYHRKAEFVYIAFYLWLT
jgi:hypothetical protein